MDNKPSNLRQFMRTPQFLLCVLGLAFMMMAAGLWVLSKILGFQYSIIVVGALPMAYAGAAAYVGFLRKYPFNQADPQNQGWMPWASLALAIGITVTWAILDPFIPVDDTGFIARYLRNFQEGCFYCYNLSEGPVFGISSFLYGLLTGTLAFLGLDPILSIKIVTYTGITLSIFLILRILSPHHGTNPHPSKTTPLLPPTPLPTPFFLALFTLTTARAFWAIGNSGMEAPLHLAICLAAIWFYATRRDKCMWLFLALAVMSKLDAVPLVAVIGLFWLVENGKKLWPLRWDNKPLRHMLLLGVAPLLVYLGATTRIFGSPLPQSAYAKVYFHHHAETSWFPFADYFTHDPYRLTLLLLFGAAFATHHVLAFRHRAQARTLATGWAFLGVMALYYVYNPGERMEWYYVLPEMLMLLQTAISIGVVVPALAGRRAFWITACGMGLLFLIQWTHVYYEVKWFRKYEYIVEGEREMLGRHLAATIPAGDTLFAGHGLLSAFTEAHVIDYTGLNSRLATTYKLDDGRMVRELKPGWLAVHGWAHTLDLAASTGYTEDTVFYDVTQHQYPAWRVFRKTHPGETQLRSLRIPTQNITSPANAELSQDLGNSYHRIIARNLTLRLPAYDAPIHAIQFGIYRKDDPFDILLSQYAGDSIMFQTPVQIAGAPRRTGPPYHTQGFQIPYRPGLTHLTLVLQQGSDREGNLEMFELVDPEVRVEVVR